MRARVLHGARCLATGAILWAALVRLLSAHSRFPWWEVDPTRQFLPETTLRPSHGLMLDLVVWIASLLGVGACVLMGERLRWRTGVLALIGAAWALVIGVFRVRAGSVADDFSLGSAWAAAVVGAWATTHIARHAAVRAGLIAVLAGVAWTLAFKGGYQVFVEHPATVAHYKANADAVLTAQGLEPGSAGAREFERRLLQAEATGWVGLSNAHASVLAACLMLSLGLAASGVRAVRDKRVPSGAAGVLGLGAVAAAAGLALTSSKGGILSGVVGAAVFAAGVALTRQRCSENPEGRSGSAGNGSEGRPHQQSTLKPPGRLRFWLSLLALGLPALALVGVVVRGVIGERWGELSLLFRSQYLEGSLRVIADSFPSGVGPGGFKGAYALHKPALSPETVESPHSVFFDWLACLGLGGAAWCGLLIVWTALMGRCAAESPPSLPSPGFRASPGRFVWLTAPVAACAAAWLREGPTITIDEYPIRGVAVLAWVGAVACALRFAHGRAVTASLFAAGVALVTHAQIEVTPVLPGTASFALLFVALAATKATLPGEAPTQTLSSPSIAAIGAGTFGIRRCWTVALLAALMGVPVVWMSWHLNRVWRWEASLRSASESARSIADARGLLVRGQIDPRSAAEVIRTGSEQCARHLTEASRVRPESLRADEAAARVLVGVAADMVALRQPEAARDAVARAVAHLEEVETRDGGRRAGLFAATAAGAYQALQALDGDPTWLERAVERWRTATARDPNALTPVLRSVDALVILGREREARTLAARALEIDENLRLDPIKRMPAEVRVRLERLARE